MFLAYPKFYSPYFKQISYTDIGIIKPSMKSDRMDYPYSFAQTWWTKRTGDRTVYTQKKHTWLRISSSKNIQYQRFQHESWQNIWLMMGRLQYNIVTINIRCFLLYIRNWRTQEITHTHTNKKRKEKKRKGKGKLIHMPTDALKTD